MQLKCWHAETMQETDRIAGNPFNSFIVVLVHFCLSNFQNENVEGLRNEAAEPTAFSPTQGFFHITKASYVI